MKSCDCDALVTLKRRPHRRHSPERASPTARQPGPYAAAAQVVAEADTRAEWSYRLRGVDSLVDLGTEFGDNQALPWCNRGFPRGSPSASSARSSAARLGGISEQSRHGALEARGAGGWDQGPGGGGDSLSRGVGGTHARLRAVRLGGDADTAWNRTLEAWRAGAQVDTSSGSGSGLSRGAGGTHTRSSAARLGGNPNQPRQYV